MKRLVTTLTLLAVGLSCAFVWLPEVCGQGARAAARTSPSDAAPKFAFIDMGLVLRHYKKAEDLAREVKAAEEAGNAKINQMVGQGQELEKPLRDGSIERESPEFVAREKKVIQLATHAQTYKAVTEKELKQHGAKAMLSVYRDMTAAVDQFARQNNYTLVMRIDREAVAATSYRSMQQTMAQPIVRHDARNDITDEVTALLNKQYEAAGGAASLEQQSAPAAKTAPRSSPSPTDRKVPSR